MTSPVREEHAVGTVSGDGGLGRGGFGVVGVKEVITPWVRCVQTRAPGATGGVLTGGWGAARGRGCT